MASHDRAPKAVLTEDDMRAVRAAVRRGRSTRDAGLALAVIYEARSVEERGGTRSWFGIALAVFGVVSLVASVPLLLEGGKASAYFALAFRVFSVVGLLRLISRSQERSKDNAVDAGRAARRQLGLADDFEPRGDGPKVHYGERLGPHEVALNDRLAAMYRDARTK